MARMSLIACILFFMTSLAHSAPVYYAISGTYEWEGHDCSLSGFVQFKNEVAYFDDNFGDVPYYRPGTVDFFLNDPWGGEGASNFTWFIENYNFYDGITHYVGGGGYIDIYAYQSLYDNEIRFETYDWAIPADSSHHPFWGSWWTIYDPNGYSFNLPDKIGLYSNFNMEILLERMPAPVPEPATALLFASGLAGLALYRRIMKKL